MISKCKKIFIPIILGFILFISGLLCLQLPLQKVLAENKEAYVITEGCFDRYTNSEYYYDIQTKQEDKTKELKNYPNYFSGRFQSSTEGKTDEWILGFVPEELFTHVGQYFYVGKTYGFFVDSKETEQFIYLFDMVMEANDKIDGCVEVKLMPFFYHTYYYEQGKVTINSYKESNTFVIKDVSFGAALSNVTYANKEDATYNATSDNGAFLLASEYYYNGRSLKEGMYNPEETGLKIVTTLVSGALPHVSAVVGTVFDIALKVVDLAQTGLEFYENSKTDYAVTKSNDTFRGDLYHTTKDAQLNGSGGLPGYPDGLRKLSLLKMETGIVDPVLYEPNKDHYVQAKYLVGTTDHWKTKLTGKVGLDIMREVVYQDETTVDFAYKDISSNCFNFNFWEDTEQPQKYEDETEAPLDLLKDNFKQIEVIANDFTGEYVFEADGANIKVYNSDKVLLTSNINQVKFDLEENTSAFIEIIPNENVIKGDLHTRGKFHFEPSTLKKDSKENITLLEFKKYTYSYNSALSNAFIVSTNNKNIGIKVYRNGVKTYEANGKNLSFLYKANEKIYIEIINNINSLQSVEINLSSKETFSPNQEKKCEIQGKENLYYNFSFNIEGKYKVINSSNNVLVEVVDENGVSTNQLNKQKFYFVKVYNSKSASDTVNINIEFDPTEVLFGNSSKNASEQYVKFYTHTTESYSFENVQAVYDYTFTEIELENNCAYLEGYDDKCYYLKCNNKDYINIDVPFTSIDELEKDYTQISNQKGQSYYKVSITYSGKYEIISSQDIILFNSDMELISSYEQDCQLDLINGSYYIKLKSLAGTSTSVQVRLKGQNLVIDQEHVLSNNGTTIFKFIPKYNDFYTFLTRGDINNTLTSKITLYEINAGKLVVKSSVGYSKYLQLKTTLNVNSIYYIEVDLKNASNQALIFLWNIPMVAMKAILPLK